MQTSIKNYTNPLIPNPGGEVKGSTENTTSEKASSKNQVGGDLKLKGTKGLKKSETGAKTRGTKGQIGTAAGLGRGKQGRPNEQQTRGRP